MTKSAIPAPGPELPSDTLVTRAEALAKRIGEGVSFSRKEWRKRAAHMYRTVRVLYCKACSRHKSIVDFAPHDVGTAINHTCTSCYREKGKAHKLAKPRDEDEKKAYRRSNLELYAENNRAYRRRMRDGDEAPRMRRLQERLDIVNESQGRPGVLLWPQEQEPDNRDETRKEGEISEM